MNKPTPYRHIEIERVQECEGCARRNHLAHLRRQALAAVGRRIRRKGPPAVAATLATYEWWRLTIWFINTYHERGGVYPVLDGLMLAGALFASIATAVYVGFAIMGSEPSMKGQH